MTFRLIALIAVLMTGSLRAQTSQPTSRPTSQPTTQPTIGQCLVIEPLGRTGRNISAVDPVESSIVNGTWTAPEADEVVKSTGGREYKWRVVEAKENTYTDGALQGGWAYVPIESPDERIVLLTATGHALAYVNGEPRAGDVYELGYVRLPIELKRGTNHLLFVCARGRLRVEIAKPRGGLMVEQADATTPDFINGVRETMPMGVLVTNATTQPVTPIINGEQKDPQVIPPLSVRKIRVQVPYGGEDVSKFDLPVTVTSANDGTLTDSTVFSFRVVPATAMHKRTFISEIDGSVQYFAVQPRSVKSGDKPALILSLHGASVEATNQANAYSAKSWAHIVCPTNRRPFGFDWEDWGRLDAMEVLRIAQTTMNTDPTRVYLTGHSMGGHGTWQIGSLFPDRFAAIGPSAGWLSFASYRGGTTQPTQPATSNTQQTTVSDIFRRAGSSSDTQSLMPNLASAGVYILHGTDDDNVPIREAESAMKILETFHRDFRMHAQLKAGHWWENSDEPGAECVDWPAMFDFFARHRLPVSAELRDLDFRTVNPAIHSRCHWIEIDAQIRPLVMSRVQMRCDPHSGRFVGTTENVARLRIDLRHIPKSDNPFAINIDDELIMLERTIGDHAWLYRDDDGWKPGPAPTPATKRAARSGPFKLAFNNRMIFVYGTRGTPEENAAALNKARYDAETWWYRGNGAVDVVPDTDARWRDTDRNIVLYGNADTNAAWNKLLRDSPIQVNRGKIKIGDREETGEDLAALFLRPHPTNATALVAAISGTGPAGMRLTNRIPIFVSGAGLPDWFVMSATDMQRGSRSARAAGFFDNDWNLSPTDTAWNAEK